MANFYDTNALLNLQELAFKEPFVISSITLEELENIKESSSKDAEVKFKQRGIARLLIANEGLYNVIPATTDLSNKLLARGLKYSPDNIIMETCASLPNCCFITDDLVCRLTAKSVFGLDAKCTDIKVDRYSGHRSVELSNEELAFFYSNPNVNSFGLNINEYVFIKNEFGEVVDQMKWNGDSFARLTTKPFKSKEFGDISPIDETQRFAFDSLWNDEITVLTGVAGAGKTYLALSYIMNGLETQRFSKCNIVFHYETLKNQRTLGFEKGDHLEKILLTGSIGNILATKFGDSNRAKDLIKNGVINIIPTANIRGIEFSSDEVLFVTEAQDLDRNALKNIIRRCKSGCKQIYEGDIAEQIDINREPGLPKFISLATGHKKFSYVELLEDHRNDFCKVVDSL